MHILISNLSFSALFGSGDQQILYYLHVVVSSSISLIFLINSTSLQIRGRVPKTTKGTFFHSSFFMYSVTGGIIYSSSVNCDPVAYSSYYQIIAQGLDYFKHTMYRDENPLIRAY